MARTLVALMALAAAFAVVDARLMHADASRSLLGLQRCPAGCATDGCVADSTGGGYKCIKCKNRLVVNTEDGTCGCPAGRYSKNLDDCEDCDKGSYCLGGNYNGTANVPNKVGCGQGMTTIGKRSTALKACVNDLGYSYTVAADGTPSVTICPVNTYGPGLKKQRACVPCPAGYTTRNNNGQYSSKACVVPEGYYLKGPGQVAPCPKGEYKAGYAPDAACTKCAAGVSTAAEASTSEAACTVVLPGFYPSVYAAPIVKATAKCPQKFYCAGGSPTAAFSPSAPAVLLGTTVAACDYGTWTQDIGSTSANQCMTPPGHYTTASGGTVACSSGEYRADWKPASAASSCSVCGEGILSEATEQLTEYAIADATPSIVAVRATAASCYIKPGQGMYYSAATSAYRAVNCDSNNYGVANTTFGLAAFPCRDCPANMITGQALPTSGAYFVTDGTHQGFTSPKACVTKAGYGYNGRVATKCQQGWWNPTDTYSTCTQCAFGLSTPDDATKQIDSANCTLAPGYGFHDSAIVACPIGTYNSALRGNTSAACDTCPEGLSTSQAGAAAVGDCNVCALGYGGSGSGTTCSSQCGGSAATYGPAGRDAGSTCEACPAQTTGFSFDYLAQNQNFTPSVVARLGADSAADCLSEFAQIVDSAWFLGGSVTLTPVAGVASFADCVANCHDDASCQYITYDYDAAGDKCSKKQGGSGPAVVAFKAVVAGDVTASKVKSKGLASGSYTFWKDSATPGIGADTTSSGNTNSVQACLSSCDDSADCAGVLMTGMTAATDAPGTCTLIKGDASIATFKRSMTKTNVDRLSLSAVLP